MNEHDSPRAWHKSRKEMLTVLSINWDTHGDITVLELVGQKYRDEDEPPILEVGLNEVELMWPTGLRDKKAHGIYQGDVCKREFWEQVGQIVYQNGMFQFANSAGAVPLKDVVEQLKKVGTIYENPDLLDLESGKK
jgi:YopX protein